MLENTVQVARSTYNSGVERMRDEHADDDSALRR